MRWCAVLGVATGSVQSEYVRSLIVELRDVAADFAASTPARRNQPRSAAARGVVWARVHELVRRYGVFRAAFRAWLNKHFRRWLVDGPLQTDENQKRWNSDYADQGWEHRQQHIHTVTPLAEAYASWGSQ